MKFGVVRVTKMKIDFCAIYLGKVWVPNKGYNKLRARNLLIEKIPVKYHIL